jgi:hypothetical protein
MVISRIALFNNGLHPTNERELLDFYLSLLRTSGSFYLLQQPELPTILEFPRERCSDGSKNLKLRSNQIADRKTFVACR